MRFLTWAAGAAIIFFPANFDAANAKDVKSHLGAGVEIPDDILFSADERHANRNARLGRLKRLERTSAHRKERATTQRRGTTERTGQAAAKFRKNPNRSIANSRSQTPRTGRTRRQDTVTLNARPKRPARNTRNARDRILERRSRVTKRNFIRERRLDRRSRRLARNYFDRQGNRDFRSRRPARRKWWRPRERTVFIAPRRSFDRRYRAYTDVPQRRTNGFGYLDWDEQNFAYGDTYDCLPRQALMQRLRRAGWYDIRRVREESQAIAFTGRNDDGRLKGVRADRCTGRVVRIRAMPDWRRASRWAAYDSYGTSDIYE